jgi:hypothetical protein
MVPCFRPHAVAIAVDVAVSDVGDLIRIVALRGSMDQKSVDEIREFRWAALESSASLQVDPDPRGFPV